MLQLTNINELIIGDASNYSGNEEIERHIYMFNANDKDNLNTCFTAIIFAENPEEITIYSKNEKDFIKIKLNARTNINSFYDSDNKLLGYFNENDLIILNSNKEKLFLFKDMSFIDNEEVPFAIVNDEINNEITQKYFTLPHMTIEFIDPEENNLYRNLIIASLITLTI